FWSSKVRCLFPIGQNQNSLLPPSFLQFERMLGTAAMENTNLNSQINQLKREKRNLATEIENAENEITRLTQEQSNLKIENGILAKTVESNNAKIQKYENEKAEYNNEKAEYEKEKAEYEKKLTEKQIALEKEI